MSVMDSFHLEGKVALVTGGAGLFGRQIVEALAEAGAKTYMASRGWASINNNAYENGKDRNGVVARELDQSNETSVFALRDQLHAEGNGVDILVNNAVARPMKDWTDSTEAFAQSMAVNATGIFRITRAIGDTMASRGGGSIINIGSIQGMVGPDFTLYEGLKSNVPPDYFFHKSGMVNFSRYVAAKLGTDGVRCNTISPGGFFNEQDQRFVDRYQKRTFLGRMAGQQDLKGAVVFLASDASAYITGANLPVDGGYTAK